MKAESAVVYMYRINEAIKYAERTYSIESDFHNYVLDRIIRILEGDEGMTPRKYHASTTQVPRK